MNFQRRPEVVLAKYTLKSGGAKYLFKWKGPSTNSQKKTWLSSPDDLENLPLNIFYECSKLIYLFEKSAEGDNKCPLFAVDRILDRRHKSGHTEYLVKWTNYEETSWEPEQNFDECKRLIHEFYEERNHPN